MDPIDWRSSDLSSAGPFIRRSNFPASRKPLNGSSGYVAKTHREKPFQLHYEMRIIMGGHSIPTSPLFPSPASSIYPHGQAPVPGIHRVKNVDFFGAPRTTSEPGTYSGITQEVLESDGVAVKLRRKAKFAVANSVYFRLALTTPSRINCAK
jgi:hypothetical protein